VVKNGNKWQTNGKQMANKWQTNGKQMIKNGKDLVG
jgi:hypothetical protein